MQLFIAQTAQQQHGRGNPVTTPIALFVARPGVRLGQPARRVSGAGSIVRVTIAMLREGACGTN